jgi:hypothetical protein
VTVNVFKNPLIHAPHTIFLPSAGPVTAGFFSNTSHAPIIAQLGIKSYHYFWEAFAAGVRMILGTVAGNVKFWVLKYLLPLGREEVKSSTTTDTTRAVKLDNIASFVFVVVEES